MKGTAYLFQASLIIIWWILISVNDEFYQLFSYSTVSSESYFTLLVPDFLLLGILSLVRAYKLKRDLSLIILGAFSYAALFCISASISGKDGFIPTGTMVFGLSFNLYLCYPAIFFRNSINYSNSTNAIKTGIQVISFWALFLGAIPYLILYNSNASIELSDADLILTISVLLFILFSLLGLSSAYFMVLKGKGTPLPIDATNLLVKSGPYKFVRNPMAIAGVGQILSISIAFSSIHVAIYALIGGFAWHFVVRPFEEKDLLQKFGAEFEAYREATFCWFPVNFLTKN